MIKALCEQNKELRIISDKEVLDRTCDLARQEREILTCVLKHLQEVNRRRLFSFYGYKSLFEFAVKKLEYSEDAAFRRISAMKLLNEIPEVEDKIANGQLTLTHLNLAQSLFRQERKLEAPLDRDRKLDLINKISNKTVREAEKIAVKYSSAPIKTPPDKIRYTKTDQVEVRFMADKTVDTKVERLKGLLAHKFPSLTLGELFEKLCDLGLEKWDPSSPTPAMKKAVNKEKVNFHHDLQKSAAPRILSKAAAKKMIFQRANSRCENCRSTFCLEVDHILPKSKGGGDQISNLRLLCRSCNQRAAIETLGQEKMEKYLND